MASWHEQYLAALELRDSREQANKTVYDAYTRLADHNASLSSNCLTPASHVTSEATPARPSSSTTKAQKSASPAPSTTENVTLAALRADLTLAQAARITLSAELESLNATVSSLQSTLTSTSTTANGLARERAMLERKLRDRDEELSVKDRMLAELQDDIMVLEIQSSLLETDRDNSKEKIAS